MSAIFDNFGNIISALSMIVAGAAAIAAITPTPKDDAILAPIRKILDILALNVGNAKNAKPNA